MRWGACPRENAEALISGQAFFFSYDSTRRGVMEVVKSKYKSSVPQKGEDRMRSFIYEIRDRAGIHARPAGIVAKEAKKYGAEITFFHGEKKADAKKLTELMAMGIKCGDKLTVQMEGTDEEAACSAMEEVLKEYL